MLEVNNLQFRYSRQSPAVLRGINLSLRDGEIGILLAKNGAGKSTLLGNILGILKPQSGSILFDGQNLLDYLGRYLLQASLRADAADLSKLSKKTRWGYFPAVSVGWTISEEKFFEPLKKVFDSLKFRASWGQNGSLSALGGYSYKYERLKE